MTAPTQQFAPEKAVCPDHLMKLMLEAEVKLIKRRLSKLPRGGSEGGPLLDLLAN